MMRGFSAMTPVAGLAGTLLLGGLLLPEALRAQALPTQDRHDSVIVVASDAFVKGGLHRWLFGGHYRDLWATPIKVEVLDIRTFAGGLTPLQRGGGLQTKSLRFQGENGRQYAFRTLVKDAENIVPQELRGTFGQSIIQDQMSSIHPAGALVVPPIMEAVGVLHSPPALRVMPDDPGLGEFRSDFALVLGTIEERPADAEDDVPGSGFADAENIRGTGSLIEGLWRRPSAKVDSRAYLTARLLDVLVGDWDRHEDQWRWALLGEEDDARWTPIPRDRDQAFARYDGLLMGMARWGAPQLLDFGPEYSSPNAVGWNGRDLDRRLLSELERPVWDSIANFIVSRVTDAVLDEAVAQLPAEYRALDGPSLRANLGIRRDHLPEMATKMYEFLAKQVRVYAGDRDDHADITRLPDGRTRIVMARRGRDISYFDRTFLPNETEEISVYLRDGDDRALITGEGKGPLVRLIGGSGRDTLIDESARKNSKFYDVGQNLVAIGRSVDRRRYEQPSDTDPLAFQERDWGSLYLIVPRLGFNSDLGLVAGLGVERWSFGFRRQPYAVRSSFAFDGSSLRKAFRGQADFKRKSVGRDRFTTFSVLGSGIEGLRFHGYGNGTTATEDKTFYYVSQRALQADLGLGWGLEGPVKLHFTLRARHTTTDPDDPTNASGFISQAQPLGLGTFGQFGAALKFEVDTRDKKMGAKRGFHVEVEGAEYPLHWEKATGAFGTAQATASTYLTPFDRLTFAVRGGAQVAWGDYPYFAAAYLGGRGSMRGYPQNRFAGDAAVFGSAEVRLSLFDLFMILPAEFGLWGLYDVGRVYHDDDVDDEWKDDKGGGFFLGFLDRSFVLTLGLAKGDEGKRVYVGFGLPF